MLPFLIAVLLHIPKDTTVLTVPKAEAATIGQAYSTSTLRAYALMQARDYRISAKQFIGTLQCESAFKWNAVGDHGTSIGIAQFHYPQGNWGESTSSAMNPYKSIDMAAQLFAQGNKTKAHWTCWRILYGSR